MPSKRLPLTNAAGKALIDAMDGAEAVKNPDGTWTARITRPSRAASPTMPSHTTLYCQRCGHRQRIPDDSELFVQRDGGTREPYYLICPESGRLRRHDDEKPDDPHDTCWLSA